jgi:type IV pilus assembly protein PilY1
MSSFRAIPHILLVLSKDLKMFQQAYNELLDMDGDGRIDTGFNPKVTYYGYFDSKSCYRYEGKVNREGDSRGFFVRSGPTLEDDSQEELDRIRDQSLRGSLVPAARSATGICQRPHGTEGGLFSGNWLNFLVTSRMDVIRKILYGGFRLIDTPTETVLEPSLVPRDSNSWGADVLADNRWEAETPMSAYYDISKYTPFPKPVTDSAHFFARVRNTAGWGTYQVFEVLRNANKKSFIGGSLITGANGRYFDWVLQDGPNPSHSRLANSGQLRAYGLKVKVCQAGNVGEGEDCRRYPKGNLKPVGLLQKNGESGEMYFGLLSGSYHDTTRIQGGVLREHINHIRDAVDLENYGQIKRYGLIWILDTFRVSGGVEHTGLQAYTNSSSWGNPIGEMLFEGVRYLARLGQAKGATPIQPTKMFVPNAEVNYNPANRAGFHKDWKTLPELPGAECAKPIILLITDVDSEYDGDSAVNEANDLKMKVLSSVSAQEADYLPDFQLSSYLQRITDLEGFNKGEEYYFGRGRADECRPRTLSSLIEVNGICPYRVSYQGSYSAAAVAYFARTHNFGLAGREMGLDIYTVTLSATFPTLEFPLLGDKGQVTSKITILPVSMSDSSPKNSRGRILSFLNYYVLEWWVDKKGQPYHVKIKVNYEDSAQGNNPDFGIWPNSDWDMDVMIEHTIDLLTTNSPNRRSPSLYFGNDPNASGALKVKKGFYYAFRPQGKNPFAIDRSEVAGLAIRSWKANNSTTVRMALGYTISGTTHDGTYMDVGHCSGIGAYATPPTCDWPKGYGQDSSSNKGTKCREAFGLCPAWNRSDPPGNAVTRTFEFNPNLKAQGEYLPNPLYLAAKYGGFKDANRNGRPDLGEWEGPDGNPRNYFQSSNISELPAKLEAAFMDISQSVAASSATPSTVNSVLGGGISVQTAFYPKYTSPKNNTRSVSWVGTVYGLFMDKFGNFREDTNQNHRLELKSPKDGPPGDYVVSFTSLRSPPATKPKCYAQGSHLSRCADEKGNGELTLVSGNVRGPLTIHNIKSVWDAGRWLAELKDLNKRQIYYIDPEKRNEATPFTPDPETVNRLKGVLIYENYLDVLPYQAGVGPKPTPAEMAQKLIRYIRGEDIPLWRSRTIDNPWNDGQTDIVWRLGETINSKPVIVGQPAFNYDFLYRDQTYAAYKAAQAKRRQVAYFGSNDGFLHAINLGYYGSLANGEVSYDPGGHDLGAELWALIPWSALPHLQWLADPGYVHSYYVDLKPVIADVKIEGQWRTILICGLRLGGRPIEAATSPSEWSTTNFFSELFALDVTDPNAPPKVLWRYSHPDMGLVVGLPAVVTSRGEWFVVIPSGPVTDHVDFETSKLVFGQKSPYDGYSDQRARLIILKADDGSQFSSYYNEELWAEEPNSFFNDPYVPLPLKRKSDGVWNDEAVYFGLTVSRDNGGLDKGAVYRLRMVDDEGEPLDIDRWHLKRLIAVDRPVSAPVNSALDSSGNLWVTFGTGRLWGVEDVSPCSKVNTPECLENHEHYLFGVKEELKNGHMTFKERSVRALADVSGGQVYKSGQVANLGSIPGLPLGQGGTTTYQSLVQALRQPTVQGFKRHLDLTKLLTGAKKSIEMILTQPQITSVGVDKSILSFTTYELTSQSCGDFGRGFMYVVDTFTGLPAPHLALSFQPKTGVAGTDLIAGGVSTGFGQPSGVSLLYVDGKVVVRSATSENSVFDVEVASDQRSYKNLIAWREVLNTGLSLPPAVMSEKIDLPPHP